jgi:hypothetical protein
MLTHAESGAKTTLSAIAIATSLGVATFGQPAYADPPAPVLTCDARATLSRTGTKLVVHSPGTDQQRRLASMLPLRFGPFDRGIYGFEWVLFFLDEPIPGENARFHQADLLVRLEGPRSPWFRLTGPDPGGPQLVVSDPHPPSSVVRPATPNPMLPLFVVDATEEDTRSDVSLQYLIDLRPGRPRVPAFLECVGIIAWGACGVWDAAYADAHGPVACAWDATRDDFHCHETLKVETPWGGRSADREYWLLSPPEPPAAREARVSARLAPLVLAASHASAQGRQIDTIGPVRPVATLTRPAGGSLVLLGAAGDSSFFGARFLLGVLAKDGSVRVNPMVQPDLLPSFWNPDESEKSVVVPGEPHPGRLSFRAVRLASPAPGTSILRVKSPRDRLLRG